MRFRVKEGFKVRTSRKKTAVGEGVRRSEGAVRPSAGPRPESADGRASALPGRPKYASDEVSCRRNELQHYRMILPAGLAKFKRFAVNVWDVDPNGKSDRAVAEEGLAALERWMRELSLVMNISDLGATPGMIEGLTDATLSMKGGYKVLSRREISEVFRESLK